LFFILSPITEYNQFIKNLNINANLGFIAKVVPNCNSLTGVNLYNLSSTPVEKLSANLNQYFSGVNLKFSSDSFSYRQTINPTVTKILNLYSLIDTDSLSVGNGQINVAVLMEYQNQFYISYGNTTNPSIIPTMQ
jgi:hypothetical protein